MWNSGTERKGRNPAVIASLIAVGLLLLMAGFIMGRLTGNLPQNGSVQAASSIITAVPTADLSVPALDVPGDDIPGLPRYPGMRRVEFRHDVLGDLLETEVEYVMDGTLESVHDFYRQVFDDEGWNVADLHIFQGEWTFFVIQDDREALVELESRGPLIEVEIELTEPIPAEITGSVQLTVEP